MSDEDDIEDDDDDADRDDDDGDGDGDDDDDAGGDGDDDDDDDDDVAVDDDDDDDDDDGGDDDDDDDEGDDDDDDDDGDYDHDGGGRGGDDDNRVGGAISYRDGSLRAQSLWLEPLIAVRKRNCRDPAWLSLYYGSWNYRRRSSRSRGSKPPTPSGRIEQTIKHPQAEGVQADRPQTQVRSRQPNPPTCEGERDSPNPNLQTRVCKAGGLKPKTTCPQLTQTLQWPGELGSAWSHI